MTQTNIALQDLNEYDGVQTVYPVVNESVNCWRDAFAQIPPVDRAAGICSGGEISFFALAPRVRESLTLLDHSYTSMYYAIGKFHLIDKWGTKEAYKALAKNKRDVLKQAFAEGNDGLPTAPMPQPKEVEEYLAANATWNEAYREWEKKWFVDNPYTTDKWGYRDYTAHDARYHKAYEAWFKKNPRPTPPPGYQPHSRRPESFEHRWHGADKLYQEIGQKPITEFRANRNKCTFVHGDLTDLKELGPFDLVYLSNALQYGGRNGREYNPLEWVKPGGYVALTGSVDPFYDSNKGQKKLSTCEKVFEANSRTSSYYDRSMKLKEDNFAKKYGSFGIAWNYAIYKTPE